MLLAPHVDLFRHKSYGDPERRILREIQVALDSQRSLRADLEGQWVSDVQFLYGRQYQNYEAVLGKIQNIAAPSARTVRMIWNIVLRITEDMKAALLQNPPRYNAVPMNGEWDTTQVARYADDVIRWKEHKDKWTKMRKVLMAWLVSTGNAINWYEWDPDAGPQLDLGMLGIPGQSMRVGDSRVSTLSPLQVYYHPHAKDPEESPYVLRRYAVSRQWAIRNLAKGDPQVAAAIIKMPSISQDDTLLETALLDVSGRGAPTLRSSNSMEVPDEEGFVQCVEMRMVPSEEYPHGFVAKALGGYEEMKELVEVKPNPYTWEEDGEVKGGHGCVLFGALRKPGSLWFDSWLKHIRSPQVELNRRQSQEVEHANKIAAGMFIYPSGFAAFNRTLSNDPSRMYEGDPNAHWLPQWVAPPDMPSYVVQAKQAALSILNYIVAPFGPMAQEAMQKSTSGTHMALMNEDRQQKAGPIVDEWEGSWEEYLNLELRMFQRHQILPREMSIPTKGPGGRSTQWRQEYYAAADLSGSVYLQVERGSALPTSAIATLAFYAEGAKSGMLNPLNPVIMRRFYQDMKWGDALSTMDDLQRDLENAEKNLHQAQDLMAPQPLINPMVDDLPTHEMVYREFQKTDLFKGLIPQQQLRIVMLHQLTVIHLQRQMANMMAMQAAMGGGPDGEGGGHPQLSSTAQIGPGMPMGGQQSMLQGFGQATNPNSAGPHNSSEG